MCSHKLSYLCLTKRHTETINLMDFFSVLSFNSLEYGLQSCNYRFLFIFVNVLIIEKWEEKKCTAYFLFFFFRRNNSFSAGQIGILISQIYFKYYVFIAVE